MLKVAGLVCLLILFLIGKQIAKSKPTPENQPGYVPPPPPIPYEDEIPLGT